jgi:small GTP-binding protein
MKKRELIKKACLVGNSGVGKKTIAKIVAPFVKGIERYTQTIGAAVTKYGLEFQYGDQIVRLMVMVWDVTGKEDYQRLQPAYYAGAEGVIVVADASLEDSIDAIPHWIVAARNVAGDIPTVVIVNKTDLISSDDLMKIQERVRLLVKPFGSPIYFVNTETSTKAQLKAPFHVLAKEILMRSTPPLPE